MQEAASRYTPGELFWILKNGIKMSAMPSMAGDGDEMLWSTVAFLEKLPGLSEDGFNDLWMAARAAAGGMDRGMMPMHDGPPPPSTPQGDAASGAGAKPGG